MITSSVAVIPLRSIFPDGKYFVIGELYSRRAIAFRHEDFPEPDGPMITFSTPGSNWVLMGRKICLTDLPLNRRCVSRSSPKWSRVTVIPLSPSPDLTIAC